MESILMQVLQALLVIIIPAISTQLFKWLSHHIGTQKLAKIKSELDKEMVVNVFNETRNLKI